MESAMQNKLEKGWIEAGYELFVNEGPKGLKVEVLARTVGVSKSSFYHHFADMEIFRDRLLKWHLYRADVLSEQAALCRSMDDFLALLDTAKQDLLFNKMLRIHCELDPSYASCFEHAHLKVITKIERVWAEFLGVSNQPEKARSAFRILSDMFYHRVTQQNLSVEWMKSLLEELKKLLSEVNPGNSNM